MQQRGNGVATAWQRVRGTVPMIMDSGMPSMRIPSQTATEVELSATLISLIASSPVQPAAITVNRLKSAKRRDAPRATSSRITNGGGQYTTVDTGRYAAVDMRVDVSTPRLGDWSAEVLRQRALPNHLAFGNGIAKECSSGDLDSDNVTQLQDCRDQSDEMPTLFIERPVIRGYEGFIQRSPTPTATPSIIPRHFIYSHGLKRCVTPGIVIRAVVP